MLKKEITSHFLVTLIWLVAISLLRWYLKWNLVFLWLGGLFGTFLLDIDHLIYWFFTSQEKQDSKIAKMLWQKKDFKGLLLLLERYHDTHTRLIFHTALFQVIFLIFSFFIFTSSESFFAWGLVGAINLHLLKDEWEEYLKGKEEHLNDWLFWQVKKEISLGEQKIYLLSATVLFLFLTLLIK